MFIQYLIPSSVPVNARNAPLRCHVSLRQVDVARRQREQLKNKMEEYAREPW